MLNTKQSTLKIYPANSDIKATNPEEVIPISAIPYYRIFGELTFFIPYTYQGNTFSLNFNIASRYEIDFLLDFFELHSLPVIKKKLLNYLFRNSKFINFSIYSRTL